jgi:KDO2-lipid IV(A) lauroyltransferase
MIYRLMRLLVTLLSYIPFSISQYLGKMIGISFFLVPIERKRVVHQNMQESFDRSMDEVAKKQLLKKVYLHFGQMLFELPHVFRLRHQNLEKYVYFVNEKNYLNAIKKGRGVFLLTGHLGNWELMAAAVSLRYGGISVVARPIDFLPADRLVEGLRTRFGSSVIPKQKAMRKILMAIKQKGVVGILLDQNVDWYDGVFVKFLGRWACTNKGLALLALKTGAPVIPLFSIRQNDGRYCIIFEDEVKPIHTGDKTKDIEENTALYTRIIERYVQKYPDQWFWFHRRWKTRMYWPIPENKTETIS